DSDGRLRRLRNDVVGSHDMPISYGVSMKNGVGLSGEPPRRQRLARKGSGRSGHRDQWARLLLLELETVEQGVAAVFAQQFVVAAGFDHAAILDDMDAVQIGRAS